MNSKQRKQDKKVKNAITELARAKEEIARLTSDNNALNSALQNNAAKAQIMETELKKLRSEHHKLTVTEQCVREALKKAEAEAESLSVDVETRDYEISHLVDKNEQLEEEAAKNREAAKEVDKLRRRLRKKAIGDDEATRANKKAIADALRIPGPEAGTTPD